MSESLSINPNSDRDTHAKTGAVRGEDGYYTIQVRSNIEHSGVGGVFTAIVRLNEIPDDINVSDDNGIQLKLRRVSSNTVDFPTRGICGIMSVSTAATSDDTMVFNLITDDLHAIEKIHIDHIMFGQIAFNIDKKIFTEYVPGVKFYVTIDFPPEVSVEESDEPVDMAITPDTEGEENTSSPVEEEVSTDTVVE